MRHSKCEKQVKKPEPTRNIRKIELLFGTCFRDGKNSNSNLPNDSKTPEIVRRNFGPHGRWVQLSWIANCLYGGPTVVGLALPILAHKPDAKLRSPPSLIASAGAVRQLASAAMQAVQRLAEESPVTVSLS